MLKVATRWFTVVSLLFILAGALALRLAKLTFQSLRNDEHFSRYTSSFETVSEVILEGGVKDKHPPGYAMFLHYWMRAFGDSEWVVRLPSVIAGVLAVYAIYRFGRALVSERVGLTAAGLTAVAHMPLYFSQDARSYVFVMLFAIVSAHGLLLLSRAHTANRSSFGLRLLVMVAMAVTAYLHYFGLLFVALLGGCALIPLLRKQLSIKDWAIPFLGAALLYVPWLATIVKHATERSSWMQTPSERLVENVTRQLASGIPRVWYVVIALAVVIHGFDFWRSRKRVGTETNQPASWARLVSPLVVALLLWIVLPFIAAVVVSYLVIPVISARNMIVVEPAVFILISLALSKIDLRLFRGFPVVSTLAVLGVLYRTIVVDAYYTKITKRHYRAVAAYLEKAARSEAVPAFIVTEGNWDNWLNYYWESRPGREGALDGTSQPLRVAATTRTLNAQLELQEPESVWLVINSTTGMTRLPATLDGYKADASSKFVGIALRHFVKEHPQDF